MEPSLGAAEVPTSRGHQPDDEDKAPARHSAARPRRPGGQAMQIRHLAGVVGSKAEL